MLDDLLTEIAERGYTLRLVGPLTDRALAWEASVTRPLPRPNPNSYAHAVGFWAATTAIEAIATALERLETDFEIQTTTLQTHKPAAEHVADIIKSLLPKAERVTTRRF